MTTSGTYSFAPQIDDLLTEAWERLGLSPSIITVDQAKSAQRSLQYLMIDWANRDLKLWQIDRQNTTLTAGVQIIPAPPATIDILELIVTVGGLELRLQPLSRDEWIDITNKSLPGRPTQFWSERRTSTPVIHLFPVPDQAYPLAINRIRMPQDVGALSATPDAPVLWSDALAAALAARLALKYEASKYAMLKAEAEEAYARADAENRERVPLTILPRLDW